VSLRHFHRTGKLSSCDGPAYGTCVTVPPDAFVETVHIDEFGQSNFQAMRQGSPVEACGADYGPLVELPARAVACGPGALTESAADAGSRPSPTEPDAAISKPDAAVLSQAPSERDAAPGPTGAAAALDSAAASGGEGCSVTRSNRSAALSLLIALATVLLGSRKRRDARRA
jgi:hypothetical protein